MKKTILTASLLSELIEILYAVCLGYRDIERKRVLSELESLPLKTWAEILPSLEFVKNDIKKGEENFRVELAEDIKAVTPALQKNSMYSSNELNIIASIRRYLKMDKDTAWNSIVNKAPHFSRFATRLLFKEDDFDTNIVTEMEDVLLESGIFFESVILTSAQKSELRAKDPIAFAEYAQLLKQFNASVRSIITSFLASKDGLVPYEDLYDHLEEKGLEFTIPFGFTGLIDDKLNWYSEDGKLLDTALSVPTYPVIQMNRRITPENAWICKAVPSSGGGAKYVYTVEKIKENTSKKYDIVTKLLDEMPTIRKRWIRDIRSGDITKLTKTRITAVILEILFQTAARIGSPNNENNTYGISTLLCAHMELLKNGGVRFMYSGKDGVNTQYIIDNKTALNKDIISILKQLVSEKQPDDLIFTTPRGTHVGPKVCNAAFKKYAQDNSVTVHKIRTYNGTLLFKQCLDEITEWPDTERKAVKLWKEMGTRVGEKLNHIRTNTKGVATITPLTALESYVDPMIQVAYFDKLGFRVPKQLEKYV